MPEMTDQQAHDLISKLAQIMIGYEPVTDSDLLDRARELVDKAQRHNRNQKVEELFDSIRSLNDLVEEIDSEA